jgi:predicted Zn finger-like uncharacterized protein
VKADVQFANIVCVSRCPECFAPYMVRAHPNSADGKWATCPRCGHDHVFLRRRFNWRGAHQCQRTLARRSIIRPEAS